MRWTQDRIKILRALAVDGASSGKIATVFTRLTGSAVRGDGIRRKCSKLGIKLSGVPGKTALDSTEGTSVVERGDSRVVTLRSKTARTLDDAVKEARIDLDEWRVDRWVANKWDQGSKTIAGIVQVVELWQIKIWLKRAAPEPIMSAFENLCKRLSTSRPARLRVKKITNPHLLELALFDVHFGKLCWGQETGASFDVKIARRVYSEAVVDLLARATGYPVERVLYPIGQDFFQVDNWVGTTVAGTQVATDGRFQRTFEVGVEAVIESINTCLQVAPVKLLWVPGNHDLTTSWYLAKLIKAHYRNDPRVSVNASPMRRKYYRYGTTLIGFAHGDKAQRDLPTIMASERPEDWAATTCREWHVGHFHKRKETRYSAGDAFGAVGVRVLPSLSETDSWHYEHGFVKTARAAEAYLWSRDDGYVGHFAVNVRKEGKR